ncbi:Uncharacterized protein APZ42_014035 [Daphnia magna]|uniref:Uncharacterized protein n=1 Tax=Daphnia magna TaxID=35525 RepID=A0A162Q9V1_9CRUS|nr:Uncharacterized protein APZ42_014035 [Daphnia magna]
MGRIERLRPTPFRTSPEEPSQDSQREGDGSSREPVLAQRTMVPAVVGPGSGCGESSIAEQEVVVITRRCDAPTPSSTDRVEVIRRRFQGQGLSKEVVELLLEGTRNSTRAAYQSAWSGVDAVLDAGVSRVHPDGATAIRETIVERSFQSKPTPSEIFQYMGCERGGVAVGFLGAKRPIEFDSIVKKASDAFSGRNISQSHGAELHSPTVRSNILVLTWIHSDFVKLYFYM